MLEIYCLPIFSLQMDRVYLSSPNVITVLDVFINHNYGFISIGSRAPTYKWSSL